MEMSIETILALDRQKKILILAATLVLISAAYVWIFFLPTQGEIRKLDRKLSKLLNKKAEQEAIAQNLAAFKREYRHLERALQEAMAQLPDKKEIPALLENISNLGRESGLEVALFKPGREKKKDFYAEVPVDIKVLGSYPNLVGFFFKIGNLPRIVNITEMSIKRAKDSGSPFLLDTACKAVTYKFLEESERGPAGEGGKPTKKGRKIKRRKVKGR